MGTKDKKTGVALHLALAALLTFITFGAPAYAAPDTAQSQSLSRTGKIFTEVAKNASPAVVFIQVEKTIEIDSPFEYRFNDPFDLFSDDFLERFFRHRIPHRRSPAPRKRMQKGQGSGFIISSDGYILTNNHVVGQADVVKVKLSDGRESTAKVIGTDAKSDVAIIKIDTKNLTALPLGDSDALEVGEWVIAIGNPFGLSHTVTAGIVSAKGRSRLGIADYEDFIQTDAAINVGNSGGPLLNVQGKVVGINTAIFSRTGGYMGIGFAIPINMAKTIYPQLVSGGTVTRGFLGISIQPLTPNLAESFDLPDSKGILIAEVIEGSAAQKAGLHQGDVITKLNGRPVEDISRFRNDVAMLAPGTKVELLIIRDGKKKKITVKVGKLPAEETVAATEDTAAEKLGISVKTLTDQLANRFGYESDIGVIISEVTPGSVAAWAGIKSGMLILEVNHKPVNSPKEFSKAIKTAESNGSALLLINDRKRSLYVVLQFKQ